MVGPPPMNPPQPADELFELELRIAQRADELVRLFGLNPQRALDQWRQAEQEVWQQRRHEDVVLSDR